MSGKQIWMYQWVCALKTASCYRLHGGQLAATAWRMQRLSIIQKGRHSKRNRCTWEFNKLSRTKGAVSTRYGHMSRSIALYCSKNIRPRSTDTAMPSSSSVDTFRTVNDRREEEWANTILTLNERRKELRAPLMMQEEEGVSIESWVGSLVHALYLPFPVCGLMTLG